MAKSDVYSWRIAPELKSMLEMESRRERSSIASLLDRIAREWLDARSRNGADDETEQARLQRVAARSLGSISGGDPRRAEQTRRAIRRRLSHAGRRTG
jgi:hypothetical protein